jgi:ubiquinone/menaquinone biosynthesis C-methylase UbiE
LNSKLKTQNSALPAYVGLVRWAFTRLYREFAWTYDTVAMAVSGGQWFAWGRAVLPYLHGQVLELGCGTGHLQLALATHPPVARAFGLDASPQMLAITRRRLVHDQKPLRLARGIAQALPFPGASLDAIVATFPTDYIVDHATLNEIRRVLRPGGRLAIVLAATFAEHGLYARTIDLLYRATLQRSPRRTPSPTTQSRVARRLVENGFAAEDRWLAIGASQVHLIIASTD